MLNDGSGHWRHLDSSIPPLISILSGFRLGFTICRDRWARRGQTKLSYGVNSLCDWCTGSYCSMKGWEVLRKFILLSNILVLGCTWVKSHSYFHFWCFSSWIQKQVFMIKSSAISLFIPFQSNISAQSNVDICHIKAPQSTTRCLIMVLRAVREARGILTPSQKELCENMYQCLNIVADLSTYSTCASSNQTFMLEPNWSISHWIPAWFGNLSRNWSWNKVHSHCFPTLAFCMSI